MARPTDAQLIAAISHDSNALEELYRRHRIAVMRFAAKRASSPHEVVDLVGAVWLEVISSVAHFDDAYDDALPWILGIASNLCAADHRRRSRERELIERLGGRRIIDADDLVRLEEQIDAETVAHGLRHELETLPPSERAIAELVFIDDLTPAQAANALGLSGAAARMRLSRARRKLRHAASRSVPDSSRAIAGEVTP